jgi:hypothetical protein
MMPPAAAPCGAFGDSEMREIVMLEDHRMSANAEMECSTGPASEDVSWRGAVNRRAMKTRGAAMWRGNMRALCDCGCNGNARASRKKRSQQSKCTILEHGFLS